MSRAKKVIIFILAFIIIAFGVLKYAGLLTNVFFNRSAERENKPTNKAYLPVLNKHPKYYFTVKGYIDPKLKGFIKTEWKVEYVAFFPKCDNTSNTLEGYGIPINKIFIYKPKPDKNGNFVLKIAMDKYQPGMCEWNVIAIDYIVKTRHQTISNRGTGFGFRRADKFPTKVKQVFLCSSHTCELIYDSLPNQNAHDAISRHKNFMFSLNIQKGK